MIVAFGGVESGIADRYDQEDHIGQDQWVSQILELCCVDSVALKMVNEPV